MFSMTRRQWNPWRELEEAMRSFSPVPRPSGRRQVEAHQDEDGVTIVAQVPGLGPEDIEITVRDDQVTLRGKPAVAEDTKDMRCIRRERFESSFERSYRLPFAVDAAKVEAKVVNGVLTLRLPKPAAEKPHQIKVHAA